ncbi:MAG: class I SAM-dependent methyltransferase [Calothrix sp. FI2-JRJ7]|jgi:SAM-dependent methyltransferase|nr:class I SAM-dependent methyltransferase [Calothrix sp. FI2-JRJ7]
MQDNPSAATPLYTLNPRERFTERADDYVKHRPSYPAQAIDFILQGLAPASQILAADIGAGTGIASRLLAERGVKVIAVEPNAAMRETAQTHKNVEYRYGGAEATNLPDASVDLVTAFQAFHWFNPEPSLMEFRRILKPDGRLAVVWNNRNKNDAFTEEYNNFVRALSNNHPSKSRLELVEPLRQTQYFTSYYEHEPIPYRQELDFDGLIGRAMSTSYVPREGEGYELLVSGLRDLYERFCDRDGLVYIVYQTNVYVLETGRD